MIFHWWSVFIKPNMYRNGRKTVYFVTDNLRYQKLICLKIRNIDAVQRLLKNVDIWLKTPSYM
ncbi:MAG: hypothetical protein CMB33_02895 [Euryarchaeota archaeon]|nr:hypothetical protein [Euryarchaeota archaeon]